MDILMSIKRKYCDAIFDGRKTIELRKSRPLPLPPYRVFVYESKGCGMVVGEFVCCAVERMNVSSIWCIRGDKACVSQRESDAYYDGRNVGFAWLIRDAIRYEAPVPLSEFGVCRPPLSWSYLRGASKPSVS